MARRNGFRCFECDAPANHAHHIVPVVKGGCRTIPLCHSCHSLAHDGEPLTTNSQLTRYGIRLKGTKHGGQNKIEVPMNEIRRLHREGQSNVSIGRRFGVSETLIRRRLKSEN